MALEGRAGAEGDDGDGVAVAEFEQAGGFLGALDEGDGVGHRMRLVVLAVAVLLAEGRVIADPVAHEVAGGCDDGIDWFGHGLRLEPGGRDVEWRPANSM